MPNLDKFDADFFGIPESEVNYMDPQERIFLEGTYEAIIDAGECARKVFILSPYYTTVLMQFNSYLHTTRAESCFPQGQQHWILHGHLFSREQLSVR